MQKSQPFRGKTQPKPATLPAELSPFLSRLDGYNAGGSSKAGERQAKLASRTRRSPSQLKGSSVDDRAAAKLSAGVFVSNSSSAWNPLALFGSHGFTSTNARVALAQPNGHGRDR